MTILVLKVLATVATTGSGAVGGVFTPTLFCGAVLGSATGAGPGARSRWPAAGFAATGFALGVFLVTGVSAGTSAGRGATGVLVTGGTEAAADCLFAGGSAGAGSTADFSSANCTASLVTGS